MHINRNAVHAVSFHSVVHRPSVQQAFATQVCCSARRRLFEPMDAPQSQVEEKQDLSDNRPKVETLPSPRTPRRAGLPKPNPRWRSNPIMSAKPAARMRYIGDTTPDSSTGFIGVAHLQPGVKFDRSCKIHVFHDLDNLRPEDVVPEYLIEEIQGVLKQFGHVTTYTAYGNEATWRWESPLEIQSRQLSKQLARAEHQLVEQGGKGGSGAEYRCDFCGRRCKSAIDLKKHFDQLHGREMKKKMSHKRRAKKTLANKEYMQRYNNARNAAHGKTRNVLNLEQCMKNIGVQIRKVKIMPEAVDQLIETDIKQLLSQHRVFDDVQGDRLPFRCAVCIISDDRDFEGVLADARCQGWGCIAVCSRQVLDTQWRDADFSSPERSGLKSSSSSSAMGKAIADDATTPQLFSELEKAQAIKKGAGKPGMNKKVAKELAADVAKVLQSGNNPGGTWDLAAVQLASKKPTIEGLVPIGGSYPEAHMTLDFQAMRNLALERSREAIELEESDVEDYDDDVFDDEFSAYAGLTGDSYWDALDEYHRNEAGFFRNFLQGDDDNLPVRKGSAKGKHNHKGGNKKQKKGKPQP